MYRVAPYTPRGNGGPLIGDSYCRTTGRSNAMLVFTPTPMYYISSKSDRLSTSYRYAPPFGFTLTTFIRIGGIKTVIRLMRIPAYISPNRCVIYTQPTHRRLYHNIEIPRLRATTNNGAPEGALVGRLRAHTNPAAQPPTSLRKYEKPRRNYNNKLLSPT